jgi:hypothetical protein
VKSLNVAALVAISALVSTVYLFPLDARAGTVAFDAVGPSSAGISVANGSTLSWSHTVSGSNTLLVVSVAVGANADGGLSLSATYNSVAMVSAAKVHSNNTSYGFVQLFYLVAPANGSHTVQVTLSGGTADMEAGSVSFTGVNQTNPIAHIATAFGNSTTPAVTVTSAPGNMIVDGVAYGTLLGASTQTNSWMNNQNGSTAGGNGAQSTAAGSASVTMGYTTPNSADYWGIVGMDVAAASDVIDPSRAIDWSRAGVTGGIPNRTTICATLNPGAATAVQINSAIATCPSGQVVFLNAGTYNLSDGIIMKSGVTLRGAGANQTFLAFTQVNACAGGQSAICFLGGDSSDWAGDAKVQPGGSNAADWTGGYAQGTTQITLSHIGSTIPVGQYIYLDQANDTSIGPNFFVCDITATSCSLEGGNGPRVINGVLHSQVQIVKVTNVNGDVYTITPGLYSPNWNSSHSPGAWWPSVTLQDAGLENLSIDASNSNGLANVSMFNAFNSWVKGVRLVRNCTCQRDMISVSQTAHVTVQDNYFYGTQGQSQNYGVEQYISSDVLVQNNIFQHVVAPIMNQMTLGSVFDYNYAINDTYDDGASPNPLHWMSGIAAEHDATVQYTLYEGNIGPAFAADVFHGNSLMNTLFRNYFLGTDPGRIDNTTAITLLSYNRYYNIIGNVLGTSVSTIYQTSNQPGQQNTIYNIGGGNSNGTVTVANDPAVVSTLMRWGNYDTVHNSVQWVAAEVPSGIGAYANAVPSSQFLPASLYFPSKPSWWPSAKAWPPIGPDVMGGNIAGVAGHAYTIPAEDCYLNVMAGRPDGTGNLLNFNAATCYP